MLRPYLIKFPELDILNYRVFGGVNTYIEALFTLGQAVSSSLTWAGEHRASLILSRQTPPKLYILGLFAEDRANLYLAQAAQYHSLLRHFRYVDYQEAEKISEDLARSLQRMLGPDKIRTAGFVAIPRGGFIVLGMLSYLLDLKSEQLIRPYQTGKILVVVDDCAITGARFGTFLREMETDQELVFATLIANPQLRSTIERREDAVLACVSGQDLPDRGTEILGEDYVNWHQSWTKKITNPDFYYWYGRTEHVCFPWGEPDLSVINQVSGKVEDGWFVVPPRYSLERRPIDAPPLLPVKQQRSGRRPLQPGVNVIFDEIDGRLLIANLDNEHCYQLDDVGAAMWKAIINYGNIAQASSALKVEYDVSQTRLQADLEALVDDMIALNLLEWTDDA